MIPVVTLFVVGVEAVVGIATVNNSMTALTHQPNIHQQRSTASVQTFNYRYLLHEIHCCLIQRELTSIVTTQLCL